MKCQFCDEQATYHISLYRQRVLVGEAHTCAPHGEELLQREHPVAVGEPFRERDEVYFDVEKIVISELHDQQLIVLQEVGGLARLPLVAGIYEATSLDRKLRGVPSPRPLTHDVIVQSITALGGVVQDVLFNDLRDFTYYAKVRIQHRSGLVELDVRPSDALNVAVIAGVPVFIAERILGV